MRQLAWQFVRYLHLLSMQDGHVSVCLEEAVTGGYGMCRGFAYFFVPPRCGLFLSHEAATHNHVGVSIYCEAPFVVQWYSHLPLHLVFFFL